MEKKVIKLSDLDGHNGFRIDGAVQRDFIGYSVSSAGDFNGDGYDDVVVSTHKYESGIVDSSYVVFGKASGFDAVLNVSELNGSNGFRVDGIATSDHSGITVSGAGDVNGDGLADLLVGAAGADISGEDSGAAFVVFGSSSALEPTFNLKELNGNNGFRLLGDASGDNAGYSVSKAGDVNGDGFDDVIIGARGADPHGLASAGSSYLFFGKASGFGPSVSLSSLNGSNGFRMDGEGAGDFSGAAVSDAGDVNGDGFDDLLVNAPEAYLHPDDIYAGAGSTYVVLGKATGFSAAMDLSVLDGHDGFRLDGIVDRHNFLTMGFAVSSAGDINGDGFDDVIIGEAFFHAHGNPFDVNCVVFGKAEGFSASLALSDLDGRNGFRMNGPGGSISSAGDVNGDGLDDLLIGDPLAQTTGPAGASFVVYGKATDFEATMDVFDLNENEGLRLDGIIPGDQSGKAASYAGDVNGDGFDDVIIGAPYADYIGSSYVVFGGNLTHSVTQMGTSDVDYLLGTKGVDRIVAGNGNDSMIGRGGADVFHGGAGSDNIKVPDFNFQFIDGGSGNDALHLAGKDLNLDLTAVGHRIHDIETICIYGRGDNTLTLTAETLLNLSNSTNTLKVHGNYGDHIIVQGSGWIDGGSHGFYHTYSHDEAVLLVGVNLATEFV